MNHPLTSWKRVLILYQKEVRAFVYTPTLYVCLALFVFLANYLNFVVAHFFTRDEASLSVGFFQWHPWLYSFFAPAICMRLWSEEYRQKTLELLLTMGFKPWQIVCGKFLAAWTVLLAALALTLPLVYLLFRLGPPDYGATISGYLGSACVAAALLGISIAMASLSRNQFISYILGASACSLLVILGYEATMNALIRMFPASNNLSDVLSSVSVFSHFKMFQRGVITAGGLLYFTSTTALGLYTAHLLVSHAKR